MKAQNEMLSQGPRIKVFVGEFGSGKTELAVNYALQLRQQGYKTAIVDIDIVKPYFRTRENRRLLEDAGITVVAPEGRLAHADLPTMPHDLARVLYQEDCQVVMDVGGGESAIVLGQLNKKFADNPYQALLVVNTCRPFTSTPEAIVDACRRIGGVSRLKVTGLVSNTNLAAETTKQLVLDGLAITEKAAAELGLPINWVVVPEWLAGEVSVPYPLFVLKPYTVYPWME
jgi:hypothetical protein